MENLTDTYFYKIDNYEPEQIIPILKPLIEKWALGKIKKNDKVLLKPNLLMAKSPEAAITTHPSIVESTGLIFQELGCEITISDSPGGVKPNPEPIWIATGMRALQKKHGWNLVHADRLPQKKYSPLGIEITAVDVYSQFDWLINLPKVKSHTLTLYTGAVKNLYGLIPGFLKGEWHKAKPKPADFGIIVSSLYKIFRPALNIIDGITGMEGNGPSQGIARHLGFVGISEDALALDCAVSQLINMNRKNIHYLWQLSKEKNFRLIPENFTLELEPPFRMPGTAVRDMIPGPLAKLLAGLVNVIPATNKKKCIGCGICARDCPVKAIEIKNKIAVINREDCILCFCCNELCPYQAMEIKKSLLARLFV